MQRLPRVLLVLIIVLLAGCSRTSPTPELSDFTPTEIITTEQITTEALSGHIRVKMEKELLSMEDADCIFTDIIITSYRRTFPECGKFEARTRAEGLHLWYELTFDPSVSLTKATKAISKAKGVTHIEYVTPVSLTEEEVYPFNDPMISKQWNFKNSGSKNDYVAGSDINLFPAWEISTGSPDVIVAVVDAGVQWDHEDLAGNIWTNQAEYNGTSGVDDDNNGYIDDIHGYNFTAVGANGQMAGTLTPGNHGSNVASIISAVNNNGIGVSSIAGGDGENKGVQIMCCQIMNEETGNGYPAEALKYAADNGAVIAQNSWSSESGSLSSSLQEAIDYFNKYAGVDENDVQTSLMKGGLVVFAAGNENTTTCYPAMYEPVMAIASLGPNFKKSSFSNYGEWVDIAAPGGGELTTGTSYIYGCFAGNTYGGMAGTSQACPHISGVAALILSHYGKDGFTNKMLWDILVKNSTNVDSYNEYYKGKLGSGLVDAYRCLTSDRPLAPDAVSQIDAEILSNIVTLKWAVPIDADNGKAFAFDIYSSTRPIDSSELKQPLAEDINVNAVYTENLAAGEIISATYAELDFFTDYYYIIVAYDNHNHRSVASDCVKYTTLGNNAPVITPVDGTSIRLKAFETKTLAFDIIEPDTHNLTFSFTAGSNAAEATILDNQIQVSITGTKAPAGTYTASFKVVDPYGASATQEITYTIDPNQTPVVVSIPDNIYMGSKSDVQIIDLAPYFSDGDGEPLTYTAAIGSTENIVTTSISGSQLTISGKWYGSTTLTVTAADALDARCKFTVQLVLRDDTQDVDLYPNPVSNVLNIRMGKACQADVSIYSTSGAKVYGGKLSINPFQPAIVDMSNLSAGSYTIVLVTDGQTIQHNIIKL